jgi:hypothetical protein
MADVWFYAHNGQQAGPVSAEELEELAQDGRLLRTDLVWKEGLPQWVQAKTVTGLFPPAAESPRSNDLVTDSFLKRAAVPAPWGGTEAARPQSDYALNAEPLEDAPPARTRPAAATGWWEALPTGAKAGILIAAVAFLSSVVAIPVMLFAGGGTASGPDDGDKTITAALGFWDSRDTVRMGCRAKVYSYRMKAGRTYTIRMLSGEFDAYLRLEDPTGMPVAEDDDGDAPAAPAQFGGPRLPWGPQMPMSLNAKIVYTAPKDGTYKIIATSFAPNMRGNFQLIITRVAPAADVPAAPGAPAAPGNALPAPTDDGLKTFSGQLTRFDTPNRFRQNSRERNYSYRMTAGTTYTIRMTSESHGFDPYLRLENPFGQVVAEDDDGDGFPNARITYICPQSGSYRIIATSFGGTLGNYTVTVTPNR